MEALTKLSAGARIRRSAEQWRELLNRFEHSGQTREQFCTEQGLALSSFTRWRGKLRQQRPAVADGAGAGEAVFVELAPDQAVSAQPPRPWELELQLGGGLVVRVRRRC